MVFEIILVTIMASSPCPIEVLSPKSVLVQPSRILQVAYNRHHRQLFVATTIDDGAQRITAYDASNPMQLASETTMDFRGFIRGIYPTAHRGLIYVSMDRLKCPVAVGENDLSEVSMATALVMVDLRTKSLKFACDSLIDCAVSPDGLQIAVVRNLPGDPFSEGSAFTFPIQCIITEVRRHDTRYTLPMANSEDLPWYLTWSDQGSTLVLTTSSPIRPTGREIVDRVTNAFLSGDRGAWPQRVMDFFDEEPHHSRHYPRIVNNSGGRFLGSTPYSSRDDNLYPLGLCERRNACFFIKYQDICRLNLTDSSITVLYKHIDSADELIRGIDPSFAVSPSVRRVAVGMQVRLIVTGDSHMAWVRLFDLNKGRWSHSLSFHPIGDWDGRRKVQWISDDRFVVWTHDRIMLFTIRGE